MPAPTGTVTFYDGATAIGAASPYGYLGSGYATDLTSKLTPGTHEITAVYSGDSITRPRDVQPGRGDLCPRGHLARQPPRDPGGSELRIGSDLHRASRCPGQQRDVTATVTVNGVKNPGTSVKAPTGAVSFYDNGTTLLGTSTASSYRGPPRLAGNSGAPGGQQRGHRGVQRRSDPSGQHLQPGPVRRPLGDGAGTPDAARAYGRICAATVAVGRLARGPLAVDHLIAAVACASDLPATRNVRTSASTAWSRWSG